MIFYLGTHMVNHARYFEYSLLSVNRLRNRRSDFVARNWIMDSGAFTELLKYGDYRFPVCEYASQINRWSSCGNLEYAVCQDYMCEPFILEKTGLDIKQHQALTISRYDCLVEQTVVPILPVLQGYKPRDYLDHLNLYGKRMVQGARVGVGSVCKRNREPSAIIEILETIKGERPDLKLHGFGLKATSLENGWIANLLYSADSMAWSYAARRQGRNASGFNEALSFYEKINYGVGRNPSQLKFKLCDGS